MGDNKAAEGCISGRHSFHTYIPWYYGKKYSHFCDICGEPAAWHGGATYLCDCHAEDWSRWNDKDGRLYASKRIKQVWGMLYREFRKQVKGGMFVPNDFKGTPVSPISLYRAYA